MRLFAPLAVAALAAPAWTQTSIVTVDAAGALANNGSLYGELSLDARFVAFQSGASNLVSGDNNAEADVFLFDRLTLSTIRVSVATGGGEGDIGGLEPAMTDDARFIGFFSYSTNLVPNDTNASADIFVRDVLLGITERVSVATGGGEANAGSRYASLSGDGRWVAFESKASNLVAGDTNGERDLFLHDRQTGVTTRVSVDGLGGEANGESLDAALSPEGRWLAFESDASNLVPGDTNGVGDVFLKDLLTGAISRISVDSAGVEGDGASVDAALTNHGRYVAFVSSATNLVAGDTNAVDDIFLRDVIAGTTVRVSRSTLGAQSDDHSHDPQITPDARFVVYYSEASNLDHYTTNVHLHDVVAGTTERISVGSAGQAGSQGSYYPAISADGRFVAFDSASPDFVLADQNGVRDVFLRDRASPYQLFCFGDGTQATPCPCANDGSPYHGCQNSASTGGATLEAAGDPSLDNVRFVITGELPSALSFVMQATGSLGNRLPFGDGVLCISGGFKRLYTKNASGGKLVVPGVGDLSVSARSAALGDPLVPGTTRYYQVYYRDPSPTHCGSATFNLTNAVRVDW